MPGVKEVEEEAFDECRNLVDVECNKLEIVEESAFAWCISLTSINLSSATDVVEDGVFADCPQLNVVTFGKDLERVGEYAFFHCSSLKQITIPLKNRLFPDDDTFQECDDLMQITLVDEGSISAALFLEEWRNEMRTVIDSINHDLPNAYAGDHYDDDYGEMTIVVREWISSVLSKIIRYKARHRGLLNALETSPSLAGLPDDVVRNHVLPYLTLPSYAFDGEDENVVINPSSAELAWIRALVWPTVTESDVTAAEVDTIDEGGNKDGWLRSFLTPLVIFVVMVAILSSTKNVHVSDIIALMLLYRMNLIISKHL